MNKKKIQHQKTAFIISLSLFISLNGICQNPSWFEPGTSWTYNYGVVSGPERYQVTFDISEAVFADRDCVKMEAGDDYAFQCSPIAPPYYFYESNDSVFFATPEDGTFRLAYDFGAETGDTWSHIIPVEATSSVDTFQVEVLEVNEIDVAGETLKELVLAYTNVSQNAVEIFPAEISVLEYIGATSDLFVPLGKLSPCDFETTVNIQCFSSPSFEYINPAFGTCTVAVPDIDGGEELSIYPNPASDAITINWTGNEKGRIRIIQLDGKVVLDQRLNFASAKITLPELSSGMYMVEVSNEESRNYKKLYVE